MIAVFLLLRQTSLDYCHMNPFPTIPPDKGSDAIIALSLCIMIGLLVFISAVRYALVRLRIATHEEFNLANER